MSSTYHVACDRCRCLVSIEPLSRAEHEELLEHGGRFGAEHLGVLERALGADHACVTEVKRFVDAHRAHRVVLDSPDNMHGVDYFEGLARPASDAFSAALAEGTEEGATRALQLARDIAPSRVVDRVLDLALSHESSVVRARARTTMTIWRPSKAVNAAIERVADDCRARAERGDADPWTVDFHVQRLLSTGTPESLEQARRLLPGTSTGHRAAFATTLFHRTEDPTLIEVLIDLANASDSGESTLKTLQAIARWLPMHTFERDVATPLLPTLVAQIARWQPPITNTFLELLAYCGPEGRAVLEGFVEETPPYVSVQALERVLDQLDSDT